jgi:hypothetical protein
MSKASVGVYEWVRVGCRDAACDSVGIIVGVGVRVRVSDGVLVGIVVDGRVEFV